MKRTQTRHAISKKLVIGGFILGALIARGASANDVITDHASATGTEALRLTQLREMQALRFPAPDNCQVVGVWEDGSIVAYCDSSDSWLAHGPDSADTWTDYDGPVFPVWVARIS